MARTKKRTVAEDVSAAAAGETVEVTSENFEALLLASAKQASAIARGAARPARTTTIERTERDTVVAPPRRFDKTEVRALRDGLRVSQGVFARLLGVSAPLARAWELGTRVPSGPAARMLELMAQKPTAFQSLLGDKAHTRERARRVARRAKA